MASPPSTRAGHGEPPSTRAPATSSAPRGRPRGRAPAEGATTAEAEVARIFLAAAMAELGPRAAMAAQIRARAGARATAELAAGGWSSGHGGAFSFSPSSPSSYAPSSGRSGYGRSRPRPRLAMVGGGPHAPRPPYLLRLAATAFDHRPPGPFSRATAVRRRPTSDQRCHADPRAAPCSPGSGHLLPAAALPRAAASLLPSAAAARHTTLPVGLIPSGSELQQLLLHA